MNRTFSYFFSIFLLSAFTVSASGQTFSNEVKEDTMKRPPVSRQQVVDQQTTIDYSRAFTNGRGVYVEWQMKVENAVAGYVIHRVDSAGKSLVSDEMVGGSAFRYGSFPAFGETYSFYDPEGGFETGYILEVIGMDGSKLISEVFTPHYLPELSVLTGRSYESFASEKKQHFGRLSESGLAMPKTLQKEIEVSSFAPDLNTHRWVISQPGVRIGVRKNGVYRVTRAQLQAGGFNVNSDHNLWQLYLEGNQQSIIVGNKGDYIEFIGRGIDRVESDTQMYFLINGPSAGKRILDRVAGPSRSTITSPSYRQTYVLKERTNYINTIRNGDAENYWGRVVTATPTTLNFSLTGVDFNRPNSAITIRFQGFSSGLHEVSMVLNGHNLGTVLSAGQIPFGSTHQIPTEFLVEGQNSLQMSSIGPSGDVSLFDLIQVTYDRKFLAQENKIESFTLNDRAANVTGFSSQNVRVFDTTYNGEPTLITNLQVVPDGGTFSVRLPGARERRFIAVDDASLLSPASIAPVNPEMLGIPTHGADLIIISYKDWMAQAEVWANYRRNQGFTVKVVEVSDIFDEFNYGVLSADSMKSFLNYAYHNWQLQPRYLLLLGDASFDSRNYQGFGFFNFVPVRIINTIFTETASDEFLADFNNNGLASMAVGRVAARNGQTITNVMNKVVHWESNLLPNPLTRGALFAFDFNDQSNDFEGMSNRLRQRLPADTPATMVFRGQENAQQTLINTMNTGKYIVNYSGHGSTGAWAATSFFANSTVPLLTNANNESIFVMLTCLNGFFHNLVNISLAENLVEATNGGAVAAWASTGLTTADVQEIMGQRFYQKIGDGDIPRLGDLITDAKTVIPGGMDVRLSWALIGDPMLKVR
jgi:hypothetical protein